MSTARINRRYVSKSPRLLWRISGTKRKQQYVALRINSSERLKVFIISGCIVSQGYIHIKSTHAHGET